MNAHDRFINVEGSINLRDFGGYSTTEGRTVKRGYLYRCGAMSEIAEHAYDDFAGLNITVICDLRSDEEVEHSPTPAGTPFDCRVHIPIWPGSSTQFQESVRDKPPNEQDFTEFMRNITREIVRDHVDAYTLLMRELVETDNGFLLHCSAGKDRTGIGAAVILSLLDVDRETIVQDYLISNQAIELIERTRTRMMERMEEHEFPPLIDEGILHVLSGVKEDYLRGAFEEIDQQFGGTDGYLEAVGITNADRQYLKEKLLD